MKAAADGLVLFLLTVVLVWTVVFGVSASAIARQRGRNGPAWFAIGALTGPLALCFLWWDNRQGSPARPTRPEPVPDAPAESAGGNSYFDL